MNGGWSNTRALRRASPRRLPTPAAAAGTVAAVLLAVFTVLVLVGGRFKGVAAAISAVGFPAAGLVYVPLAALAAARTHGRLRAAWLLMTAGFTCTFLGDLIWSYYKHTRGEVPFPSWADVAYLSYVPFAAVGLLTFPSRRSWREQSRLLLDGVLVTCSFFLISWIAVMRAAWRAGGNTPLEFMVSLAFPAGDLLVVTIGFLVLLKAAPGLRMMLTILVVGLACTAVGNGVWAYLGDPDAYRVGGLADIFFAAYYLLLCVATVAAQRARPIRVTGAAAPGLLSLWLPLVPVALAAVFVATSPKAVVMEAPVVVAGSVLIVGTLFRQFSESSELVRREQEIRRLADRLTAELDSASRYVDSILPLDLVEPIEVCSRYLPARAVGGDSFGHQWVDEDHLVVYLVDVSGHGVRPALLSVSVHNVLRSGGLPREVLLAPERVLGELNSRFSMDDQDGHYFTMWYGVYERSTGRLRYANAGHPPPLVLISRDGVVTSIALGGGSVPVGMFADTGFAAESYPVPPGARLMVYSDGVLGDLPNTADFVALCEEVVGEPSGRLDDLLPRLPATEDDCSLVLVSFPAATAPVEANAA